MYRVVVKDNECGYCRELWFDFDEKKEALDFCAYILEISNYGIEIIKFED